jgi:nucleotide-binding universal stress UspA family protein
MMSAFAAAPVSRPLPAIKTILFATDFSPCSNAAMPYACTLAKLYNAKVHLLNVVGPEPLVGPLGVPYADTEQEHERARRELRALADCPQFVAPEKECSVHRGKIPDVICRIVEDDKIDLVVMGTHGRHGVRQFVIGSVAEDVFRHASCPVLTIGPGAKKLTSPTAKFATIVVATDLSAASQKVILYGEALALKNEGKLVLCHVIPDGDGMEAPSPTYLDDQIAAAKKRLAELVPKSVRNVETSLKVGQPAELIIETASERGADLIVVGARRGPRLASHAPWAVAHEIVCAAPCPVMTVCH